MKTHNGGIMRKTKDIDFARLLGFDMVSNEVSGRVNFQDDAIEAKLGAKVGAESWVACDIASALASAAAKAD